MINPMMAAKAYAAVQGIGGEGTGKTGAASEAGGLSFGDLVTNAINNHIQTSKYAEAQMVAGVQGKAELIDVVTALSSAETSLQTMVAVRDQVISAYQEIMRMQI